MRMKLKIMQERNIDTLLTNQTENQGRGDWEYDDEDS
jgi:hypothetical protein